MRATFHLYSLFDGGYMPRLLFQTASPVDIIIDSYRDSYARMESRSRFRSEIGNRYDDFLGEYRELNRMELVTEGRVPLFKPVYILRHA